MNKKLFTLAAALMMGSAFMVNAQTPGASLTTGADIDGNTYYYLCNGANYLIGKPVTSLSGAKFTAIGTATSVSNLEEALWKVVPSIENGVSYVELVNKKTQTKLAFAAGGADVDPTKDAVVTKMAVGTNWNTDATSKLLELPANTITITTSSLTAGSATYLVYDGATTQWVSKNASATPITIKAVAEKPINSTSDLNDLLGNGFTFNFPDADPAPANNVFGQKLVAVKISGTATSGYTGNANNRGTYFVVSAPDEGIIYNSTEKEYYFKDQTSFENSTVVVLDPVANYGINGFEGKDKKFTTILAGNLKASAAAGQTPLANAKFTVVERDEVNAKGAYSIQLSPYFAKDANTAPDNTGIGTQHVMAITTMGATYVTVDNYAPAANKVYDAKVSGSNVLAAADLLKTNGPAVFNIQFTSGYDKLESSVGSEYGKYLHVSPTTAAGHNLLAEGSTYVNLDAPESQWIITDYADGIFTFADREGRQTLSLELRKTDKENVYNAHSTANTKFSYAYVDSKGKYTETLTTEKDFKSGEIQIKLVPATMTLNGGFADFTKEEMEDPIQIKFTMNTGLFTKEMYMTADTKTNSVGLTTDEDEAALWDIVKFATKKDSISSKVSYAYLKNKQVAKSDAVANIGITTYALKLNGEDLYFDGKNNMVSTKKVAEAPRQIIKVLNDGSLYIFGSNTATSNTFAGNVGFGNQALSVSTSAELADNLISIYDNHQTTSVMEFESVKLLSESLEAQPRHASFQSIYGGIMGMDENNDAIIAATKDEAQALTFWLDTTDVKELSTRFYISQAVASEPEAETKAAAVEPRMFLFNAADSISYYDEGTASMVNNPNYQLSNNATKAIFKAGTLINKDSINTIVKGKEVGLNKDNGLNRFKFQILEVDDEQYVIKADDGKFLSSYNGKLGFGGQDDALIVTLGAGDATANEAIAAEAGVQVIGGQGVVTVQGAAGKVITVANILGQTIANQVAASDNVTIAVPAGIAVVSVDGEATKVVVK